jgi:Ca2+-binding RTX toxin-like protein
MPITPPSITGAKWGPSNTHGTPGGEVTWSYAPAGLDDKSGIFGSDGTAFAGLTSRLDFAFFGFSPAFVLESAFRAWSAVADITFRQVTDGGGDIGVGQTATIRLAGVEFVNSGKPAETFVPVSAPFGFFAESGDVIFSRSEDWTYSNLQVTALHEIGHAIGLGHNDVNKSSIMHGNAVVELFSSNGPSTYTLHQDDIDGIRAIYGAAPDRAAGSSATGAHINLNETVYGYIGDDTGYASTSNGGPINPQTCHLIPNSGCTPPPGSNPGNGFMDQVYGKSAFSWTGSEQDWFVASLAGGVEYHFSLEGVLAGGGTLRNPILQLMDSNGFSVATGQGGDNFIDSTISYTPSTSGTYYLNVSSTAGDSGTYQLNNSIVLGAAAVEDDGSLRGFSFENNRFIGGLGNDVFGGSASDWVDYSRFVKPAEPDTIPDIISLSDDGILVNLMNGPTGNITISYWAYDDPSIPTHSIQQVILNTSLNSIENVIGTAYDDVITGTNFNSELSGYFGNDDLRGGDGHDRLDGGYGDDTLRGNGGNDRIVGGAGTDAAEYAGDESGFTIVRNSDGSFTVTDIFADDGDEGTDTLFGIEQVYFGAGIITKKNALAGVPTVPTTPSDGLDGILLEGNDGDNTLEGTVDADELRGGLGNDIYIVNHVDDRVIEGGPGGTDIALAAADEGIDTVISSLSAYKLPANVENLNLAPSTEDLFGTGNNLANTIQGNEGNNFIDGGSGVDALVGGGGNDTYAVDVIDDVITELEGAGYDTVIANNSYTLSAHLEELILIGTGDFDGFGNSTANVIRGNSGNNYLAGAGGDDLLVGGSGQGDDTYDGGDDNDTVTYASATQGITVSLLAGTASGSEIDTDTLVQIENVIAGAGADVVVGDTNANELSGGDGDDILDGYLGHDTLKGGADRDSLFGNNGNDILDGGEGADWHYGGAGNDTYYIDDIFDFIDEGYRFPSLGGGGTDTLYTSSWWYFESSLNWAIDNFYIEESAAGYHTTIVANGADNMIYGNSGDNNIYSNWGNDWIWAGAGTDHIDLSDRNSGASGANTVYVAPGAEYDVIWQFLPGVDAVDISAYGHADFSTINTGNDGFGNSYYGLGGIDVIIMVGVEVEDLQAGDFLFV